MAFVPNTNPDFDTSSDGMSVAFRDKGGQHHALVTAKTNPLTGKLYGAPMTHAMGAINASQTGTAATELLIASCVVPGGSIGTDGELHVDAWFYAPTSNANVKKLTIKYGGEVIAENNNALTSARSARFNCGAYANGSESEILAYQTVGMNIAVQPASTGSNQHPVAAAVDTSVDQLVEVFVNLSNAADEVFLKRWRVSTVFGG